MEENIDDLFKFSDDLADNKMDDTKYKESLLANLYSQAEFLKEELKEKNDVIGNLLNRIKTNNCVIFPRMSMTNDDESYGCDYVRLKFQGCKCHVTYIIRLPLSNLTGVNTHVNFLL